MGKPTQWLLLASLIAAGLVQLESAHAGSFGGVEIGCTNPHKLLGYVRGATTTTVFQTTPDGLVWRVKLPPVTHRIDHVWFAPDGGAAVVALSFRPKARDIFLITEGLKPIGTDGAVREVDFQEGRALIATAEPNANGKWIGRRVRVYDLESGEVIGDSRFEDRLNFEATHDASQELSIRLSADGRYYYYVRWTPEAGAALIVRDVVSGRIEDIYDNHVGKGIQGQDGGWSFYGIQDALLLADGRGYMVSDGDLFRISGERITPIELAPGIRSADKLIESPKPHRLAVNGGGGWGVLDTDSGEWLMSKSSPYRIDLQWSDPGLIAVDKSRRLAGMKVYDLSDGSPHLVRKLADKRIMRSMCVNAHGFMAYADGDYVWVPSLAQP